jgi:hypothetical protein
MMLKTVENVIVVESHRTRIPIGIARANDLLELRRWLMEEETRDLGTDLHPECAKTIFQFFLPQS